MAWALHFGELQTARSPHTGVDTASKSMDTSFSHVFTAVSPVVSEYRRGCSASPNTHFSSSRVLWSRARRGFPVRSSSCNFGGRFSGKVTSLSSLQLRSTHWRKKWNQERRSGVWFYAPTLPRSISLTIHYTTLAKYRQVNLSATLPQTFKTDFAKCCLNIFFFWITQKIHTLNSPYLFKLTSTFKN